MHHRMVGWGRMIANQDIPRLPEISAETPHSSLGEVTERWWTWHNRETPEKLDQRHCPSLDTVPCGQGQEHGQPRMKITVFAIPNCLKPRILTTFYIFLHTNIGLYWGTKRSVFFMIHIVITLSCSCLLPTFCNRHCQVEIRCRRLVWVV